MDSVLQIREEIYNYFHSHEHCQQYFIAACNRGDYAAYYNSMYLLQDTAESIRAHRQRGFSDNSHTAYLEFWGLMQAIIIQQDAIRELYKVAVGEDLKLDKLGAWHRLRTLRNVCAGHPASSGGLGDKPVVRTFMGRKFGTYRRIVYEKWEAGAGISHPHENLGALFDEYADEAAMLLSTVLSSMTQRWA